MMMLMMSARVRAPDEPNRTEPTSIPNVCVFVLVVYARNRARGDVCGKTRASNDVKKVFFFVRALFPQNLDFQYPYSI